MSSRTMTEAVARSLTDALATAFSPPAWDAEKRAMWTDRIVGLHDASAAYEAVSGIIDTMDHTPRFADFRRAYQQALARRADTEAWRSGLPVPVEQERPRWTYVWAWARFFRDPKEERSLPQQYEAIQQYAEEERAAGRPYEIPPAMDDDEYDALLVEWEAAGSPKVDPLRAMGVRA